MKKKLTDPSLRARIGQRWSAARKWLASDQLRRVRSVLFQAYILIALLAFAGLAVLAASVPTLNFDVMLTQALQRDLTGWAAPLVGAVSWIGYAYQSFVLIISVAFLLYAYGLRWEALTVLFATTFTGAINYAIKVVIARPRPSADLVHVVEELNSFSFPSGHVMFYTTFFGFLLFLTFTLLKRSWLRLLLGLLLLAFIVLVGPSRMLLGEHWGSDVLGGYLLGSLTLILTVRFYHWGKERYFIHQPVAVTGQTETNIPPEEQQEIREALKNPVLPKKELERMQQKAPKAKQTADGKDTQATQNYPTTQEENDAKQRTKDNPGHP